MNPRLAILSGGRAGTVEPLTGAVSSIGRHATCRVRLDADQDTEVSNRHAVIQKKDGVWTGPPSLVQFRNISIKELK